MKPQYLRVRNWERFQHYTNRRPPWVKYHVELLDDYELLHLPLSTQLVFDRLLLLAARTDNNIPHDPVHIGRQITIETEDVTEAIERLLLSDHLVMSGRERSASKAIARRKHAASKALAERKQSSVSPGGTETETEVEEERTIAPPLAARKSRERDHTWEALLEACGIDGATLTKTGRGAANKALHELKDVGAVPSDIRGRAVEFKRRYPSISLTPSALAKHWGSLRPAEAAKADKYAHLMEVPAA